jgi:endonuclease/exonuclease/phosphatase family metal-dependent hydrolase
VDVKLHGAGPLTDFPQQYRLLHLAGVTFPNPRQQCVNDLKRAVAKAFANQEAVIIIGDFNEQLGRLPNLMASVIAKNDIFDVHAKFHGIEANIPTYARGTTCLDYCGASVRLADFVHACGFNLLNAHIVHSDHRASFVDLLLKSFFGQATPTLARP